ncbi:MAG TPA: carbohydrate ABC transporter permease [Anaerolineae bacterium]|nr:carbohydrate ABC transporter permease [Anaerolineae bacterium]HIP72317.1 carbohydrate ABC transporter permease [Anaerolineae bacterium]
MTVLEQDREITEVKAASSSGGFLESQKRQDKLLKLLAYFLLTLGGLTMVIPFIWMISTSLKPASEIYQGNFFPNAATLNNYRTVLLETPFLRWYLNSFIVATISTASVVFFDSLIGFVFAKYHFPLKNVMFLLILSTLMIPTEMLLIPWFIMSVNPPVGPAWVNSYWGIAFPGIITAAGAFLMRQFMTGVPDELLDAGRIDGVSEFGLFWRIAMPLTLPAMAALAIFNFLGNWNAYIWPLIVTSDKAMMTLPVGLSFFSNENGADWHLIMTGATLSVVPLMIVFIIFQRQIIKGIALTGVKG